MADFVAVLKKTIGGLSKNTPEARERVYQKARDTVAAKLAAMQPAPSGIVVERQKKALEAAISAVEAGFARDEEPEDEFAAIFAGASDKKAAKPAEEPAAESEPVAAEEPRTEAQPETPAVEVQSGPGEVDEPAAEGPVFASAPAAPAFPGAEAKKDEPDRLEPVEPAQKPKPVLPGQVAAEKGAVAKPQPERRHGRRVSGGLIAAAAAAVVVAAAGYGIWLNRDAFMSMFAPSDQVVVAPEAEQAPVSGGEAATDDTAPATEEAAAETPAPTDESAPANETETAAATTDDQQKFTQRLTAEGDEVDPGPAGGQASIGEGTSVASATQNGDQSASASTPTDSGTPPASGGNQLTLPVGQRAIFYEERTTASSSTAEAGATVWSVVQESPGGDLPPEPAIRAEVSVPSKGLQLRMTIRRNADASLPASHIIEMIFLTSERFEGGGIDNVLRVAFKQTEAAAGNQLLGIPAKIADGYFLIALSDVPEEREFNLQLMRQQSWIDIPIVYSSGRRALVTMERGVPGDRAFIDVLATWQQLASEESAAAGN
jgi:hypothetical protein